MSNALVVSIRFCRRAFGLRQIAETVRKGMSGDMQLISSEVRFFALTLLILPYAVEFESAVEFEVIF
jgi:hypothetical protein